MHLRVNEVTVSPARVDELGGVLSNKALPVVLEQKGCRGLLCAANRATGDCAIVSLWDTRESLDASEKAIAYIRSETVDVVGAQLNRIMIADVLREVRVLPSQVGSRSRVVRITARGGSADQMLDFYETEAVPRLEAQPGFLNARLIREVDNDERFAAVSHWIDAAALEASDKMSGSLREQVADVIAGTVIERVTTAEIILIELMT
jgi:heme-degrading monooxygenase HmoA